MPFSACGELANIIWEYHPPAKQGYKLDISAEESSGPAAVADVPPDWGTVLPKADVSAGSQVAQKCQSCHNFQQGGPNMTGPNLYGVVGRGIGSHPGYDYDQPMKDFAAKNPVWTYDLLYTYLKTPGHDRPGHEDDLRRSALAGRPDQHHRLSALPGLDPAGAGAASRGRGRVQRAGQGAPAAAASSAAASGASAASSAAAASSAPRKLAEQP